MIPKHYMQQARKMRCRTHLPAVASLCALVIALVSLQEAAGQAHQEAMAQEAAHQEAALQVRKPGNRPRLRLPAGTEPTSSVHLNSKNMHDHRPSFCTTITCLQRTWNAYQETYPLLCLGVIAYLQLIHACSIASVSLHVTVQCTACRPSSKQRKRLQHRTLTKAASLHAEWPCRSQRSRSCSSAGLECRWRRFGNTGKGGHHALVILKINRTCCTTFKHFFVFDPLGHDSVCSPFSMMQGSKMGLEILNL